MATAINEERGIAVAAGGYGLAAWAGAPMAVAATIITMPAFVVKASRKGRSSYSAGAQTTVTNYVHPVAPGICLLAAIKSGPWPSWQVSCDRVPPDLSCHLPAAIRLPC